MGKGGIKKKRAIAAEQGNMGAVLTSGASSFVYNGDVNLAPLSRLDLHGATLIFNGKVDLRTLEHVNLSGAKLYLNGEFVVSR